MSVAVLKKLDLPPPGEAMTALAHLRASLPHVPESRLREALHRKDVKAGGVRLRGNVMLEARVPVTVYIGDDAFDLPAPEIVYEDAQLMVCDKPQGLIVEDHQGGDSLDARAAAYAKAQGFTARLCHRLDAGTGGLVILAKTQAAYAVMHELLKTRALRRFYEAVVLGEPPEGRYTDGWIKGVPRVRIVPEGTRGSLPCETIVRVLASDGRTSRIEAEIVTGRTHQIRAQLAWRGYPVLGDDVYGDREWNRRFHARQQQLFSTRLIFPKDVPAPLQGLSSRQLPTGGYNAAKPLDKYL